MSSFNSAFDIISNMEGINAYLQINIYNGKWYIFLFKKMMLFSSNYCYIWTF